MIRYSGKAPMWYSGIDQHKQYCVITTYGPDGPRVKQGYSVGHFPLGHRN